MVLSEMVVGRVVDKLKKIHCNDIYAFQHGHLICCNLVIYCLVFFKLCFVDRIFLIYEFEIF